MRKLMTGLCAVTLVFVFHGLFSQPSKYEGKIVRKIEYQGLRNMNPEDLNEIIRTTVGYPLKADEVRQDIKDIFAKGKFENVSVEVEEYQDGVWLRFILQERPIIKTVEYKGLDEVTESDLQTLVLLKEGDPLRKDYVEKSIKAIRSKYEEEGLFNSVITYRVEPLKGVEGLVKLVFVIDEGEVIAVRKIKVLGAKKISSRELESLMETTEKGLFKDGDFKADIYEQDKAKILAYYKERGYLDAEILEDLVEYEWVNPEKKDVRGIFITIKVSEGGLYYFDKYSMEIHGEKEETVFLPEDFTDDFEQNKQGAIFNDTMFQRDRQSISFRYATKGYIFARVVPNRTVTEREVTVKGKKEMRKFVAIHFTVEEGTQAYIEQIIIKGNKKTKDKVIRRELLFKEGELFDARKMQLSREKVYNLGYFKEVNMEVRPGSQEGFMNLIIDVEEQPTGTISLGGGYGTTSGFSIFADVGENNFLGNGQHIGAKFEYGPLRSSITLNFTERWLFNQPIALSTSIFYYLHTLNETAMFGTSYAEYKKQAFGYSLGLSYRFPYYYTIGANWSHTFKSYLEPSGNVQDTTYINVRNGLQEKRTLSFYVFHDSRDNYMNPTRGARIGMNVGFTGGNVLGGGDHFIEYTPELYFYFTPFHLPMLKTHPIVFEFRASGDFIKPPFGINALKRHQNPKTNEWVEEEDRLYIGGPETVRGWEYYDNYLPDSWRDVRLHHRILYGLEMRIPIHPQMLWVALFFDAGSLWTDSTWMNQLSELDRATVDKDLASGKLARIQDFAKTDLMSYFIYSYGFGFRIQIPMMPLRFWFGKKFIYEDHKFKDLGGLTFQFGIGDTRF